MDNKYTWNCRYYDTECKSWMCDDCPHNPDDKRSSGEKWQHRSFY